MTSHTHPKGMKWFITYIIEAFLKRGGQASRAGVKWLERAKKGKGLRFLFQVGVRAGVSAPMRGQEFPLLFESPGPKEGIPGLF